MSENTFKERINTFNLDKTMSVKELKESCRALPDKPGVYFVFGDYKEMPEFLTKGSGPEFHVSSKKGAEAMNYPTEQLENKWIDDEIVMYIGKTDDSLYTRISNYIKFGKGEDVSHRGGRAIWQLPDSNRLVIGWKVIEPPLSARAVEKDILKEFKRVYGKLPFANWKQ